jgi:hypothetical protein
VEREMPMKTLISIKNMQIFIGCSMSSVTERFFKQEAFQSSSDPEIKDQ